MLQVAFFVSCVVAHSTNQQHFLGLQGNHMARETSEASLREDPQECDENGCSTHDGDCCVHSLNNQGIAEKCANGATGSLLTSSRIPQNTRCHKLWRSHKFTCCPKSANNEYQEYCNVYATTAENCQYPDVKENCEEECKKFEADHEQHQNYCNKYAIFYHCKNDQGVRDYCKEECEKLEDTSGNQSSDDVDQASEDDSTPTSQFQKDIQDGLKKLKKLDTSGNQSSDDVNRASGEDSTFQKGLKRSNATRRRNARNARKA